MIYKKGEETLLQVQGHKFCFTPKGLYISDGLVPGDYVKDDSNLDFGKYSYVENFEIHDDHVIVFTNFGLILHCFLNESRDDIINQIKNLINKL